MLGAAEDDGREFVAGGYAAALWTSHSTGQWVSDPWAARLAGCGSFLFSLVDAAGHGPAQLRLKDPTDGKALRHRATRGPLFGGGTDLALGGTLNKRLNAVGNSWTRTWSPDASYDTTDADAQSCTTFGGSSSFNTFTVKALEVFALQRAV